MHMSDQINMLSTMFKTMSDMELHEATLVLREEQQFRRERKSAQNRSTLREGSIVEWVGNKSGACTGVVVRVKRKKAIVKQTSPVHSRYYGTNWDIPMSMLTVVS